MARTKLPGKDLLDSLTTLILALPGTGIGIAYLRAFREPMPLMNTALIGIWVVIPLVLGVRRLPYTVRGNIRFPPPGAQIDRRGGRIRGSHQNQDLSKMWWPR